MHRAEGGEGMVAIAEEQCWDNEDVLKLTVVMVAYMNHQWFIKSFSLNMNFKDAKIELYALNGWIIKLLNNNPIF